MALSNTTQVLADTQRLYTVKLTGIGGQEGPVLKIDAGSLRAALNANGQILVQTTGDRKPFYRLDLVKATFDVNSGNQDSGFLRLYWTSNTNNTDIVTLSRNGTWWLTEGQFMCTINNNSFAVDTNGSPTGNVGLQTYGFGANSSYTLILTFRKNAGDYDQGQSVYPSDFNQGAFSARD